MARMHDRLHGRRPAGRPLLCRRRRGQGSHLWRTGRQHDGARRAVALFTRERLRAANPLFPRPQDARISAAGASTAYSGTFRWVREHWCPDFPQFPPGLARPPAWRHCTGWAAYLALRLSSREPHPARRCLVHPAVVDALSLPLSVLHALDLLAPSAASPNAAALSLAAPRGDEQRPRLRVVVLGPWRRCRCWAQADSSVRCSPGAAARAEQALLTSQPAYWVEVGHMCPSVDVELVVRGRRAEANPALSADTGPLPTQLVGPELDAQGPDTAASGPKKRKGKGKKKEKKKKQKPSNKLECAPRPPARIGQAHLSLTHPPTRTGSAALPPT